MRDFLLYDVWGGFVFSLPLIALSIFVGWKFTKGLFNGILRKFGLKKKTIKLISIPIIIMIFIIIKSFTL